MEMKTTTNQMQPSWQYMAGLLDGEGCIAVCKYTPKDCNNPRYRLRVTITQKNEGFLQYLKTFFGGLVSRKDKTNSCHYLIWWDNKAGWILENAQFHLIIKKEQAKVGLQFLDHKRLIPSNGRGGLSEEVLNERERFKSLLHALKRD